MALKSGDRRLLVIIGLSFLAGFPLVYTRIPPDLVLTLLRLAPFLLAPLFIESGYKISRGQRFESLQLTLFTGLCAIAGLFIIFAFCGRVFFGLVLAPRVP